DRTNRGEQERLRELHADKERKPLLPYSEARANRTPVEWHEDDLATPSFLGVKVLDDVPLATLADYIDWTFFFHAWELKGRFPKILDDPRVGAAARDLYDNARELLGEIVEGGLLRASGVYGFWPATAVGDDVV